MSVLDRVNRNRRTGTTSTRRELTAGASQTGQESSTPTPSEPPVIHRLRSVVYALQKFVTDNSSDPMLAHMAPLMTTFMDEIAEELGDRAEVDMSVYMSQIGLVIAWIGHGDNDSLPPELRVFAEAIQPSASNTHSDRVPERDSNRESPSERDTWTSRALAPTPQT